jgi:LysR family transcriptional regulator, nitrogen assimilation regulatory protein
MNLRQLHYFAAVSELQSVTRAAEHLHVAQPALTRHIRTLERDLGVQLFAKKGRGIALTSAGVVFHDRVRTILRELDRARAEVKALSPAQSCRINVGLPYSISQALTRVLLERVSRTDASISVRVIDGWSGFIVEYLLHELLDVGVIYDYTPRSELLYTEPLAAEEQFLVCTPKRRPPRDVITLAEVAKLPLALPSHEHGLRVAVERIAHAAGIALDVHAEIESIVAIKQSALAGETFAILPHAEIDYEVAAGCLVKTRIVAPAVHRTLHLAWPKHRPVVSTVRRVVDLMKEETAALIEQGRWATRFLGHA